MKELIKYILSFDLDSLFRSPTDNSWIRFFRYCFVGGLSFVIDFSCYTAMVLLGINYLISGFFAFIISFAFNFLLSRHFIFSTNSKRTSTRSELTGVFLVAATGMVLTEVLLWLFCEVFDVDKLLCKVIVSIIVLVWNYLGRATFVYKKG